MNYKWLTFFLYTLVCSQTFATSIKVKTLSGAATQTKINIGAFLEDDCRNERNDFSDYDKLTVKWILQADPNDLQQEVGLISVVKLASFYFYQDEDGVFNLMDGEGFPSLKKFAPLENLKTVTLTSNSLTDTIISSIILGDVGLGGLSYEFFVGYKKSNGEIIISSEPYRMVSSDRTATPITEYWPCSLKQGNINIKSFLSSDTEKTKRTAFTTGDNITFTAEITPNASEIDKMGFVYLIVKNLQDGKTYIYNDTWTVLNLDDAQPTKVVTLLSNTSLQLFSQELKGLESDFEFSVAYTTARVPTLENLKFSEIYKISVSEGEPSTLLDSIPDAFSLTDRSQAKISTSYNSNTITVSGIDDRVNAVITLSNGEYSINSAVYTSDNGVIRNGDKVTVRLFSSENAGEITEAVLTIGGISDSYRITTNTSPTISQIANQTINQNTSTSTLIFTIADTETQTDQLIVSQSSDNTTLIDNSGIVLGGSGTSRTITLTPKNNQTGMARITLTVNDGSVSTETSFNLTVKTTNTTPTVSSPGNQIIDENTATSALGITIGDNETNANSLALTASSSNITLIDNAGIVLSGSGTSRTITLTPKSNQTGTATITLTISDGSLSRQTSFLLTVNSANTAPTISAPSNQSIDENTATTALTVTVGDTETAANSLVLTASSSNTNLIESSDMVLAGTGASRTITLTPKSNQNGTATITLSISDGSLSTQSTFALTVNAVNTAPTITGSGDQITIADSPVTAGITVDDVETSAASLILTASSDNATLIDNSGIVLGGSGASRTITLTPNTNQTGTATITLTLDDGELTSQATFNLDVQVNGGGDPLCLPEDPGFPDCIL